MKERKWKTIKRLTKILYIDLPVLLWCLLSDKIEALGRTHMEGIDWGWERKRWSERESKRQSHSLCVIWENSQINKYGLIPWAWLARPVSLFLVFSLSYIHTLSVMASLTRAFNLLIKYALYALIYTFDCISNKMFHLEINLFSFISELILHFLAIFLTNWHFYWMYSSGTL